MSALFQTLIQNYGSLRAALDTIYQLSQNIRLLSFNSSVEAARAGQAGRGFRIIAGEIKKFSEKSDESNKLCGDVVNTIEGGMQQLIGVRTADMAFDLIDKIDRNLFERNCDVQAWATFGKIISALESPSAASLQSAREILSNLVKIYEVYLDIVLCDLSGKVVCTGVTSVLEGTDVSEREWFRRTVESGKVYVTDMYHSATLNAQTVAYSCPVCSLSGQLLGVISTRFNWKFIYDIVDKAMIGRDGEIYVVNKQGTVIASKNKGDVLNKSLSALPAMTRLQNGTDYGYDIDAQKDGKLAVFGFARTQGYNAYRGKDWSVIVREIYQ